MSSERSRMTRINGRPRPKASPERRRARCVPALLAVLLCAASAATAQTSFLEVTPPADPYFVTPPEEDFWVNAVAPADVDGDGDLDLAVLGFYVVYHVSAEDRLVLFINNGPDPGGGWLFSHQLLPLGSLTAGASDLAWADFDGDADYDLAVGSDGATVIYRNDCGLLAPLDNPLPGYWEDSGYTGAYDLRSLAWADADNDGDPDLLIPSVFDSGSHSFLTVIMRNDGASGDGWVFTDAAAAIDPTVHAQSAWADDDADGDLDLFLVNVDPYTETGFVRRFGNDGGAFTASDLLAIRVEYGLADWGDYDGDGDLDILVAGNIQEAGGTYDTVLRVYRNDGGIYTEITLVDAPNGDWLDLHAATWADYDSDGDVDLLITGNFVGATEIEGKSDIWANDGGVFTALGVNLPAPISSIGRGGTFTWFDLDGDGDLDYLVAGAYYVPGGNGLVEARMHLYRNEAGGENLAPTAPTNLTALPVGGGALLSWDPAQDDSTPPESITYDLDLRPVGGGAMGAQHPPEPGDVSAVSSWVLTGLAPGSYVWSVRAVDSAFNAGPVVEGTLTVTGESLFSDGFESGDLGAWSTSVP
jgi:hypothetical protein